MGHFCRIGARELRHQRCGVSFGEREALKGVVIPRSFSSLQCAQRVERAALFDGKVVEVCGSERGQIPVEAVGVLPACRWVLAVALKPAR
jgi:hypothetical protein